MSDSATLQKPVVDRRVSSLQEQLEAAREELNAHRAMLRRQLDLAASVQDSLLPRPVRDPRIHIDVRYMPIEQVGGDYCQLRFPDQETCYVTICDVTGHGIGPALLAARVSSEVRHGLLYGLEPHQIVRSLNTFIRTYFSRTGLYLTFLVAKIDLQRHQLTYCGAGHPAPLLIHHESRSVEPLHSQNTMVGALEDILADDPENTVSLEPGDRLVFYTDGLIETAAPGGRQLGTKGLGKIAASAMDAELFEMADRILDPLDQQQWGPTTDDRTLIVAEIR